jgi:hypothetical protein
MQSEESQEGMKKFQRIITAITIVPAEAPLYCEDATVISIQDHAAGEFLEVVQPCTKHLYIDKENWPAIRDGIDYMLNQIRDPENEELCK